MTLAPWEYLLKEWRPERFPDIYWPVIAASVVFLVGQVIVYNVRTRQLRRFEPLEGMQEWFLWTGFITFGLVLIQALFRWYFLLVLVTLVIGLAVYAWTRFRHFPPIIAAYNQELRRARFFSQAKYKHPEATIRQRANQRTKKRKRR